MLFRTYKHLPPCDRVPQTDATVKDTQQITKKEVETTSAPSIKPSQISNPGNEGKTKFHRLCFVMAQRTNNGLIFTPHNRSDTSLARRYI